MLATNSELLDCSTRVHVHQPDILPSLESSCFPAFYSTSQHHMQFERKTEPLHVSLNYRSHFQAVWITEVAFRLCGGRRARNDLQDLGVTLIR